MFKHLLARLFGVKPKADSTRIKVVPPRATVITGYQPCKTSIVTRSSSPSRRDDSSDLLNPLNPLSPVSPIYHSSGDSHHHSSSHNSGGYDSGSFDSSSSSSGSCD